MAHEHPGQAASCGLTFLIGHCFAITFARERAVRYFVDTRQSEPDGRVVRQSLVSRVRLPQPVDVRLRAGRLAAKRQRPTRGRDRGAVPVASASHELSRHIGRVTEAANDIREQRLVEKGASHEPASEHRHRALGQRQGAPPALLLVPFRSSPSPLTRTNVLVICTVPTWKSTCDQTTARASPIRTRWRA